MSKTPTAWPAKVRTTMQPTVEIEVDEAEYIDLSRQGLLVTSGKGE